MKTTLSPRSLARLVLIKKEHDDNLAMVEITGAEISAWEVALFPIILDSLGVPAESPTYYRDSFFDEFFEMGYSEEDVESFFQSASSSVAIYYSHHTDLEPRVVPLDTILVQLLQIDFKWGRLRDQLEEAGITFSAGPLDEFDLMPIVLDELGVPAEGSDSARDLYDSNYRSIVIKGTEEECRAFLGWARKQLGSDLKPL